ncbi:MAG: ATP-binding protein, partial [Spirochaetia bacterium]
TIEACIAWSFNLLSPPEQELFRQLSVFQGGWTLEDVQMVCGKDQIFEHDPVPVLLALVDKSMIQPPVKSRYSFLEPLRQYALEMLKATDKYEEVCLRHRNWFKTLALRLSDKITGNNQADWIRKLSSDYPNIRAAIRWSLERNDTSAVLEFAGSLFWYWFNRGKVNEGLSYLLSVYPVPEKIPRDDFSRGLCAAPYLLWWTGDYSLAHEYADAILSFSDRTEPENRALILLVWATAYTPTRNPEHYRKALEAYEEALKIYREMDRSWGIIHCLLGASVTRLHGIHPDFEPDFITAEKYLREASSLADQINDIVHGAKIKIWLADCVLQCRSDIPAAIKLYAEVTQMPSDIISPVDAALAFYTLAEFQLHKRDNDGAAKLLKHALDSALKCNTPLLITNVLGRLSICFYLSTNFVTSALLINYTSQFRKHHSRTPDHFENEIIKLLRKAMVKEDFNNAAEQGFALNLEQAVDLARSELQRLLPD